MKLPIEHYCRTEKDSFKYLHMNREKNFYYQTEELWECKKGFQKTSKNSPLFTSRKKNSTESKINPIKSCDLRVGNKK